MFFHVWEKWYVQSEATEVCEFLAKIPAFYCSLQRRFAHIHREKFWLDFRRLPGPVFDPPRRGGIVRYLRTHCFCIRNLTRSLRSLLRFLIRYNSCVNTVRQHFPWSILYFSRFCKKVLERNNVNSQRYSKDKKKSYVSCEGRGMVTVSEWNAKYLVYYVFLIYFFLFQSVEGLKKKRWNFFRALALKKVRIRWLQDVCGFYTAIWVLRKIVLRD